MEVTRKSMVSGKTTTMDLDITQEQLDNYSKGVLLQNAFPHLNADEREFIKSGITPEEWKSIFGSEDEGPNEEEVTAPEAYVSDWKV